MAEKAGEEAGQRSEPAGSGQAAIAESPWIGLLKEAVGTLIPLVVSGGALLAFVAFAGSIVLWTRFDAVHIPPEQAVAAVPQGESIAIGGTMLLLFGFFGAAAVIAVYLIDRGGRATPGMSRGLLIIVAIEAIVAIWLVDVSWQSRAIASEVLLLAVGMIFWATFVGSLVRLKLKELPDLKAHEGAQEERDRAFRRVGGASGVGLRGSLEVLGIAVFGGALAFILAREAFSSNAEWGWMVGLGAAALVLLAAVGAHWLRFERTEREALDEKRANARRSREGRERKAREAQEEECRHKASRRAAGAKAMEALRWVFGRGFRASWAEQAQGRPSVSVWVSPASDWQAPRRDADRREEKGAMGKGKPPAFEFKPFGVALVVPLVVVAAAVPAWIVGKLWLAATLFSLALLGAALWRTAMLVRGRFIWYGLAVLISVPLFGTVMLMARNIEDPQVQPVALIRSTDGPGEALQGLYVTETSERVYFANVATRGCGEDVVVDSGRLIWVPTDEVVAMSIGPLQDVESAGRSALEMAYALTPDIETSSGGRISLRPEGEAGEMEEGESDASEPSGSGEGAGDADAEGAGDAGGEEEKAEDGDEQASEDDDSPGHRLEDAGPAVRPTFGRGLRFYPDDVASPGETLELRMAAPDGEGFGDEPRGNTLRLNGVELPLVRGADGEAEWEEDRIAFEVPESATSGVVTIACGQLAGQPFLTVEREPTARIAVRMQAGSERVVLDGRKSAATVKGEDLARSWTIDGRPAGTAPAVSRSLQFRIPPYVVKLKVTDPAGESDVVRLRLLRLPASRFAFDDDVPDGRAARRARRAVLAAARVEPLAAIELHGHADDAGDADYNLELSMSRAANLREALLDGPAAAQLAASLPTVPVVARALGEGCPIDRRGGRRPVNRRVEVFVLGEGASVRPASGCDAGRSEETSW